MRKRSGRRVLMKSSEFDDIYFSAEDGFAETMHVFIGGNGLPLAWADAPVFTICETGFGTGLNMLAAWKLFCDTAKPHQRLHLVSIEKYPLSVTEIRAALLPWRDQLGVYIDRMLAVYPLRVRGFHRIDLADNVTLTLVFDDVAAALPQLDACVDAWFLDGFAPAKNPEMWTDALYKQMARLSHAGTTLATFTAAGAVRRGLQEAGFAVEKRKGYGRKRDMVAGNFAAGIVRPALRVAGTAAIVGGGIAGLAAAWHLQRDGWRVQVYEAAHAVGSGASGNAYGIINPKLTAKPTPQSAYYTAAYAYALRLLAGFEDIGFSAHGGLHLQTGDDKARRFSGYTETLGWHAAHMSVLDAAQASDVAGLPIGAPCLHYPDAAAVSPARLCAKLAAQLPVTTGMEIANLETLDADVVVLANAAAVTKFTDVPVGTVRGQVTLVTPNDVSARLRTNLSYGGYITPVAQDGVQVCGATFQPWGTTPDVTDEDHAHNLRLLGEAVPSIGGSLAVRGGRVGFRAASKDRFPIVLGGGRVCLSVAHGSHGIISGIMAGAMLAAKLGNAPQPVPIEAALALLPARFQG